MNDSMTGGFEGQFVPHHKEHYSQRAGRNRKTKGQKRMEMLSHILFIFLSIVAVAIIAFNVWAGLQGE